ncbi:MAG: hypothetical protein EXR37_05050 [Limnohabitans sp.]|nr:hypothetical protein [Limnohabitans sp.]
MSFPVPGKKTPHGGFFSSCYFYVSDYLTAGAATAAAGAASFLADLCATLCFFTVSAAGLAAGAAVAVLVAVAGVAVAGVATGKAANEAAANTVVISRAAKNFHGILFSGSGRKPPKPWSVYSTATEYSQLTVINIYLGQLQQRFVVNAWQMQSQPRRIFIAGKTQREGG